MSMLEKPTESQVSTSRGLPRWVVILAFVVLLSFLAMIGVILRRGQSGTVAIGRAVPDFSLVSYDGESYRLSDLKGKVVVLNFWASWCTTCVQEAAELEQAWRYYQPDGRVIFLGVAYTDTEPAALAYLSEYDITYPNAPDKQMRISQIFGITGVPETYFIDPQGRLAYMKMGPFGSLEEIQSILADLLE